MKVILLLLSTILFIAASCGSESGYKEYLQNECKYNKDCQVDQDCQVVIFEDLETKDKVKKCLTNKTTRTLVLAQLPLPEGTIVSDKALKHQEETNFNFYYYYYKESSSLYYTRVLRLFTQEDIEYFRTTGVNIK